MTAIKRKYSKYEKIEDNRFINLDISVYYLE